MNNETVRNHHKRAVALDKRRASNMCRECASSGIYMDQKDAVCVLRAQPSPSGDQ